MQKNARLRTGVYLISIGLFLLFPIWCLADGGWSSPLNLSSSAADTQYISTAADSVGRIHVVWSEGGKIYHRYVTNGVWSEASVVSFGTEPRIAADSAEGIHLTFASSMAGAGDIYYASWKLDSGWGPAINVSQSAGSSFGPAIAIAPDGTLSIAWSEPVDDANLIYLAESSDGMVWSSGPVPGAEGTGVTVGYGPEGALLVAWEDVYDEGFPLEIFASQRTSSGWSLPTDVSYRPLTNCSFPSLAAGSMGAHLVWEQGQDKPAIFTSALTDEGWTEGQEISAGDVAFAPAIAYDEDGHPQVVWASTANAVRLRTWDAAKANWSTVRTVASDQSGMSAVNLVAGDTVHVTWLAEATPNNRDVFYSTGAAPAASAYLYLPLINR